MISVFEHGGGSKSFKVEGGMECADEDRVDYAVLESLGLLKWEDINTVVGESPFENGHGWAMRRMRSAPMLTWIMASETSQRRS